MLWTARDAARATGGTVASDWTAGPLSIDSRAIRPGETFVALRAARDGHDFVADALAKGAGAALVSRVPDGVPPERLLVVDDVQRGIEALGAFARARTRAKVVAVTGSVGKTSTKEMLRHVLDDQAPTHAAIKSYNNHWGVPLTLANCPPDAAYAVIEVGMNHPGEIAPLARQARPDVAMVTIVAPVHLEAFDDGLDGIAREKAAIFEGLRGGTALWNADGATAAILARAAARHGSASFGTGEGADWRLLRTTPGPDSVTGLAATPVGEVAFRVGAPGAHFALNALAVLAAVHHLGGDVARAALALSDWSAPEGRGRRHAVRLGPDAPPVDLFDDAYNANPASVGAALDLLAGTDVPKRARRVAVLGDMRELGPSGPDLHAALARHPAVEGIDAVHTVGPLMRRLHDALPPDLRGIHAEDAEAMAARMRDLLRPGDAVTVKGSLSMRMARVVDAVRALGEEAGD